LTEGSAAAHHPEEELNIMFLADSHPVVKPNSVNLI
jgi:hypothetical protein